MNTTNEPRQCTTVTFWHDMAAFSVVLAILTIIFAGIAMSRGRQS